MKIRVGQLFVRDIYGCTEENTYLVCGIIKTDKPLSTETVHLLTADDIQIHESKDVSFDSRGNGLDGIMQQPHWKIKIH